MSIEFYIGIVIAGLLGLFIVFADLTGVDND